MRAPQTLWRLGWTPCICIYTEPMYIHTYTRSFSFLTSMEMNEERYLTLLAKLIGEAEHLQNNPAQVIFGFVCCVGESGPTGDIYTDRVGPCHTQ